MKPQRSEVAVRTTIIQHVTRSRKYVSISTPCRMNNTASVLSHTESALCPTALKDVPSPKFFQRCAGRASRSDHSDYLTRRGYILTHSQHARGDRAESRRHITEAEMCHVFYKHLRFPTDFRLRTHPVPQGMLRTMHKVRQSSCAHSDTCRISSTFHQCILQTIFASLRTVQHSTTREPQ